MKSPARVSLLLPAVATLAMLIGCSHNVYSPPASTLPIESARTLGAERTAVSGALGVAEASFGPNIKTGHLQMRRGISERTDISIRATRARVMAHPSADTDRDLFAGRLGIKHNPGQTRNFALIGGVGGGRSAGGRYAAGDLGFAASWTNCHAIPTFSTRALLSNPIAPREVDTSDGGDAPGTDMDTPKTTYGFDAGISLEVPIGGCGHLAPLALGGGVGFIQLWDDEEAEAFAVATAGIEGRF